MALSLRYQTASEFASRYWRNVREALVSDKVKFGRLCAWLIARINSGDITDAQARNSFNSVFGRTLTAAQWTTLKANLIQPAADRYNAMMAEADL